VIILKDKILIWMDEGFSHYGIAKFFQEIYDGDLFGIVDVNQHIKQFFQQQHFVDFKKIWFFRDYLKEINENPDLDYLSKFESKYKINLWQIAYTERYFLNYNPFYKFTKNQILKILELECKLYEKIIDECNPNYLFIRTTDLHRLHLLFEICKTKTITPLMLIPTRLGYRMMISTNFDTIDEFDSSDFENFQSTAQNKNSTLDDSQYMKNSSLFSQLSKSKNIRKYPSFNSIKKNIRLLQIISKSNYGAIYDNYGKTPLNFLLKGDSGFSTMIKKPKRNSFLNKNCIRKWKNNFIYFPLHVEPERTMLISAPFYTNQLEVVANVARSLPINYDLLVKDHYNMERFGWRSISFYKKILQMPNVKLVHPSIKPEELLKDCSLVVTINGTSALESSFYEKPAIIFSDTSFAYLPFIHRIKSYEDLPTIIRELLITKFDFSLLDHYIHLVRSNSFEFNWTDFIRSIRHILFSKNYGLRETMINSKDVEILFDKHSEEFKELAFAYVKKINRLKSLK